MTQVSKHKLPDIYLKPEVFHKYLKLCENYKIFNKNYKDALENKIAKLIEEEYDIRKI